MSAEQLDLLTEADHCDPLCPFVACDDCPHQGTRAELDGQTTIYDALGGTA